MARGKSGRLVLEVDPELKRSLYFELEKEQKTLKDWFVSEAKNFIRKSSSPNTRGNVSLRVSKNAI